MKPPKIIKPYVRSFCRTVCKNEPLFVLLRPLPNKPINNCFKIVEEHIAVHGGNQLNGWAIWEWTKVLIEAEFHCVWETPTGDLIDIAPKPFQLDKILFLPDPQKQYRNRQVNNVRKPLSRNKDIDRCIELSNLIFTESNKGALAAYHGEIVLEGNLLKYHEEMIQVQTRLHRRYGR